MPLWTVPARRLVLSPALRSAIASGRSASRKWHARPRHRREDGTEAIEQCADDRSYTANGLDEIQNASPFGLKAKNAPLPPSVEKKSTYILSGPGDEEASFVSGSGGEQTFTHFGSSRNEALLTPFDWKRQESLPWTEPTETNSNSTSDLEQVQPLNLPLWQTNAQQDLISRQSEFTQLDEKNTSPGDTLFVPGSTDYRPVDAALTSPDEYPLKGGLRTWAQVYSEIGDALQKWGYKQLWDQNVILIHNRYAKDASETMHAKGLPIIDVRTTEWVEQVLQHLQDPVLDLRPLSRECGASTKWIWINVSLWILAYDPAKMTQILAIVPDDGLSIHRTKTALSLVGFWQLHPILAPPEDPRSDLMMKVLCELLQGHRGIRFVNHWAIFHLLVRACSHEEILRVFNAVENSGAAMDRTTLLYFASHFADFATEESFAQSLKALIKAHRTGAADTSTGEFFWAACWRVFRSCMSFPDGLRLTLRVVDELAQAGVRLTEQYRDMVMVNAAHAGDAETVFSVYHTLAAEASIPTEAAFHALVLACQSRIGNAETLNEVVRSAIAGVDVRSSPLLAGTILFTLQLHLAKGHPTTAWSKMVNAYTELFDPGPLQKISLPWPTQSTPLDVGKPRMAPTNYTLAIMIRAYVHYTVKNKPNLDDLHSVYLRWVELARCGDENFAPLLKTDHVFNCFLEAFIESKATLPFAAQVVRDMFSQKKSSKVSQMGIAPIRPTLKTWSILVYGFARHGLSNLAEQVFILMRAAGHRPDVFTYAPMIDEFARTQNLSQLVRTLVRMEDDGVAWGGGADVAVGRFEHRHLLREVLRRVKEIRESQPGASFESVLNGAIDISYGEAVSDDPADRAAPVMNFTPWRRAIPKDTRRTEPQVLEAPDRKSSWDPEDPVPTAPDAQPKDRSVASSSEMPKAPASIVRWTTWQDNPERDLKKPLARPPSQSLSGSEIDDPEPEQIRIADADTSPGDDVPEPEIDGVKVSSIGSERTQNDGNRTRGLYSSLSANEAEGRRKNASDSLHAETLSTEGIEKFRPALISYTYRTQPDRETLYWMKQFTVQKKQLLDRPFIEAEPTPPSNALRALVRKYKARG